MVQSGSHLPKKSKKVTEEVFERARELNDKINAATEFRYKGWFSFGLIPLYIKKYER